MKHLTLILYGCSVLIIVSLLIAGCTSPSPGNPAPVSPVVPPMIPTTPVSSGTPGSTSCGLTTCHGLDLACGANAPQVCTMEYRLGDKCRQYARCDTGGGSCTLVTDPMFATCKACIERCESGAGSDSQSAFSCEGKC